MSLNILDSNKKSSRKAKILPQFSISSENKPFLDLLEIQRKSFFDFLQHGIPHELAKIAVFRETAKNSTCKQELELKFNPETYKFISPNFTPKDAILNGKTYACKVYVQATLMIRSPDDIQRTKNTENFFSVFQKGSSKSLVKHKLDYSPSSNDKNKRLNANKLLHTTYTKRLESPFVYQKNSLTLSPPISTPLGSAILPSKLDTSCFTLKPSYDSLFAIRAKQKRDLPFIGYPCFAKEICEGKESVAGKGKNRPLIPRRGKALQAVKGKMNAGLVQQGKPLQGEMNVALLLQYPFRLTKQRSQKLRGFYSLRLPFWAFTSEAPHFTAPNSVGVKALNKAWAHSFHPISKAELRTGKEADELLKKEEINILKKKLGEQPNQTLQEVAAISAATSFTPFKLDKFNKLRKKRLCSVNHNIQIFRPWIFLGELPLMTKRGHFILNGSPRVIVNQIARCPGIYFQEKRRGVGIEQEIRVSADLIPQRGPWLRIQSDWEGRFWARLKQEGRVKYTTLYEAFQEFEKEYNPPLICLLSNSYSTNTTSSLFSKSENVTFQERKIKEDRQKKALIRLFKNSSRYSLGKLGRSRVNERIHSSFTRPSYPSNKEIAELHAQYVQSKERGKELQAKLVQQGKREMNAGSFHACLASLLPLRGIGSNYTKSTCIIGVRSKKAEGYSEAPASQALNKAWGLPCVAFSRTGYCKSEVGITHDKLAHLQYPVRPVRLKVTDSSALALMSKELPYFFNEELMAQDLDAIHTCLERLLEGQGFTDDIDNLKNRFIRTSGKLLQQQFELGLFRLNEVIMPLLGNLLPDYPRLAKGKYSTTKNIRPAKENNLVSQEVVTTSLVDKLNKMKCTKVNNKVESALVSLPFTSTCQLLYPVRGEMNVPFQSKTSSAPNSFIPWILAKRGVKARGVLSSFHPLVPASITSPSRLAKQELRQHYKRSLYSKPLLVGKRGLLAKLPKNNTKSQNWQSKEPDYFGNQNFMSSEAWNPSEAKEYSKEKSSGSLIKKAPFRWLRTSKPINSAFREFFGSNPLSQYMDQTNPLAEITHKRRLSSMGPGGIKRETAGMEVRGIHPTHYGRVCPIETPEGKNAGLVNSPTVYGRVGNYGFLETPLYQVIENQVQTKRWTFFSAQHEEKEKSSLATCDTGLLQFNFLAHVPIPVQTANNPLTHFQQVERHRVGYRALSPIQTISIATALIPFLEHDDANRALMGSNMQRQAIPLLSPERPIVGTGFEPLVVIESGQALQATKLGCVSQVDANSIMVHTRYSIEKPLVQSKQNILQDSNLPWSRALVHRFGIKDIVVTPLHSPSQHYKSSRAPASITNEVCTASQAHTDSTLLTSKALKGSYLATPNIPGPLPVQGIASLLLRSQKQKKQELRYSVRKLSNKSVYPRFTKFVKGVNSPAQTLRYSFIPGILGVKAPSFFTPLKVCPTFISPRRELACVTPYPEGVKGSSASSAPDSFIPWILGVKALTGYVWAPSFHPAKDKEAGPARDKQGSSRFRKSRSAKQLSEEQKISVVTQFGNYVNKERISYSHNTFLLQPLKQDLQFYERSNQETCLNQRPLVQEGDWIQKGDFLADSSASHSGDLALGKNVTVAYMPWEGYNFEDAIVISDRLVSDDIYTSLHIERYEIKVSKNSQGKERITNRIPGTSHSLKHLDHFGIARISSWVQPGDILVGKVVELKRPLSPYERLAWELASRLSPKSPEREKWLNKVWLEDISLRLPPGICGRVINSQIISTEYTSMSDKEQSSGLFSPQEVHIYLAVKRKIQIGDKLAGRHGNKGIVSAILPQEDMPYLGDGSCIDMVLNPLGVPSRMNLGQIFECLLGLAGSQLGCNFRITPFDEIAGGEASRSLVFLKLYQCRLMYKQQWLFTPTFPGKSKLFDGRTGEPFENWVTVGRAYMLKLIHMVDHKIHARSTGPYSLFTRQPVRGRSRRGGQRLGEMEVWAVEGFGAAYTLQEFLTIKSDDLKARTALQKGFYKQNDITFGKIHIAPGNPEAFKVLVSELQALCLHIQM